MKIDRSQQRKEFSNLTRIHKNLAETMDKRVNEEIAERQRVEALLFDAQKEINNIKLHKQRVLLVYKMHLGQLKKDMLEMRKTVKSEMKVSMRHLEKDFAVIGGHFENQVALDLQGKSSTFQRQLESEREQWKQQVQEKEQEISGLFGSQRVNDQSKYDQIAQRLEVKTQELKTAQTQLVNEKSANTSLQLALHTLENDAERLKTEQSRLQEQLSSSKVRSERNADEQERSRAMLERTTRACRVFHNFVVSMMKAHSLSPPGVLLRESDASWQEKLDEHQLTAELDRAAESLYEHSQKAILKAKVEGSESVLSELEAAKNALHALWSNAEAGDGVYQRLPWYVAASRTVKQRQDDAERKLSALKLDSSAKDMQIQELRQQKIQLQEANNVLRFEKETIVREMSLLSQTLSRKRDQDIQEVRLDLERKMEQAKHNYGTEKMKTDQEYQITIEQLRDSLEAERRSYSSLKSQSMTYQMEMEKAHEELKDKIVRLEKEVDEIRDAAVKWKRKAKLAVRSTTSSVVGANTPTRAHFLMSASSHGTENDSERSFRMVFPPPWTPRTPRTPLTPRTPRTPRRPSSAIADLSSLMEESLHSMRKESVTSHGSFHFAR
ncbi:Transketolase [Globisporangium polare]